MCGIAGIVGHWPQLDLARFRDRAYEALAHRGPNGQGAVAIRGGDLVGCDSGPVPGDASALLIHRRLSILDVGESGHQPMRSREGSSVLTYNGEVYNYLEMRAAIGATPETIGSSGDTAVLLAALEGRGEAALPELEGMFAFAWIDLRRGHFLLARDGLGIKPLFVARRPGAIAFASEIEPLLGLPGISRRCDVQGAVQSLRFGLAEPSSRSLFADIGQVRAGESLSGPVADPDRAVKTAWYRLPMEPSFTGTKADAVAVYREEFLRSIDLHLRSDRMVGTALSGGVDSSAVVMAMRRVRGGSLDLRTVSFVASTARLSEERWAAVVSDAAHAKAVLVRSSETDLAADIDDYIRAQGEPVGGTSAYAQYCVYRAAASEGLTVMLDGQGPDEMLAGYDFYLATWLRELVWSGDAAAAARLLRSDHVRGKALGPTLLRQAVRRRSASSAWTETWRQRLRRPSVPPWVWASSMRTDVREHLDHHVVPGFSGLHAHLRHSTANGLVNLFRLADRNAMRFSIENRVPFATPRLANLALSFPPDFHIGEHGESKSVLRAAVRGIVPDVILDRRDKIGFANDDAANLLKCRWWAEEAIASSSDCPFVDSVSLRQAWTAWTMRQQGSTAWLWSTLVFLRWWRLNQMTA